MGFLMRISKWDVLVDVYTLTTTPTSGGFTNTLTKTIDAMSADVQPMGRNVDIKEYGLEIVGAGAKQMFYDLPVVTVGQVVDFLGSVYMVKGVKDWYTHSEAIIEPFRTELP